MILAIATLIGQTIPDSVVALVELRPAVLKAQADKTSWPKSAMASSSWETTWGQEAFGTITIPVDATRFRFRIPPDNASLIRKGPSPFLLEAYENGLPSYGIRRDGTCDLCRPLGIEYGTDGYCRNVSVYLARQRGWNEPSLTPRAKTVLVGVFNLYESRNLAPSEKRAVSRFGKPWFRVVSKGHGTYWIDDDMNIVGPYGIANRISSSATDVVESILKGEWNDAPVPVGPSRRS